MATILIVDDRAVNRDLLITLLRYVGHTLHEASDGDEALALARHHHPDLIIADIVMPGMDGIELVRQLRADPALGNIPVIYYTATFRQRAARRIAAETGVHWVLSKPGEPEAILATVNEALGELVARPTPAPPTPSRAAGFVGHRLVGYLDRLASSERQLAVLVREVATPEQRRKLDAAHERSLSALANLQRIALRQATLSELQLELAACREMETLLELGCRGASAVLAASHAAIAILSNRRDTYDVVALKTADRAMQFRRHVPVPMTGWLTDILHRHAPHRVTDLPEDLGLPMPAPPLHNLLVVPLLVASQVRGWLLAADKENALGFDEDDEDLALGLASAVAITQENLRLYGDLEDHAQRLHDQVTERERTEATLRASERQYRQLVENLRGEYFLYSHNPAGHFTFVSPSVKDVLGYDAAAFATHYAELLTDHPINASVRAYTDASLRGEPQPRYEIEVRAHDGSSRRLAILESPVMDADGNVVAIEGIAHDITPSFLAQELLRASERRFRTLFESASEGIVVASIATRRYRLVNPTICRLLGYTEEELLQLGVADVAPAEQLDDTLAGFDAQARGDTTVMRDRPLRRKDGSLVFVDVHSSVIAIDGEPCLLGLFTDVTDRHQLREEKEHLEQELAHLQKMDAIGQLAGGVAHDFNNILSVINGQASLGMMRLEDGHPLKDRLTEILHAGERAAGLTRQLLAFSRKQAIDPVVLDVNAVLRNLEKMLRRLIGEHIQLVARPSAEDCLVRADVGQLEQVIMNLTINARDAMPEGGHLNICVERALLDASYARLCPDLTPGDHVCLSVADTGIGMDEATLQRIFEPFFTTKAMHKGTGLGLSTVYGIVRQSRGHIEVESTPGQGTTFYLYLPRVDDEVQVSATPTTPPARGHETILVVEDQDGVRALAEELLTDAGYSVLTARDGAEALALLADRQGQVHLVLSDVIMPNMTGPQLARQIAERYPRLKMVYMSGYPNDAIDRYGLPDAAAKVIPKPFQGYELVTEIRKALDRAD